MPAWSLANLVELRARIGVPYFNAVLAEVQHLLSPKIGVHRMRLSEVAGSDKAVESFAPILDLFNQLHPDAIDYQAPAEDHLPLWLVWIQTRDGEYGAHRAFLSRAVSPSDAQAEALGVKGATLMDYPNPIHPVNPFAGRGRVHDVKSWPKFFEPIIAGTRTHELRQNDRDYAIGDILRLSEFDPETDTYTGRIHYVEVTSITSDEVPCAVSGGGLSTGYAILSIRRA
jgi:hypothetical protein